MNRNAYSISYYSFLKKKSLTAQLDNTYIVDEQGNKRPLRRKQ